MRSAITNVGPMGKETDQGPAASMLPIESSFQLLWPP